MPLNYNNILLRLPLTYEAGKGNAGSVNGYLPRALLEL